MAEDDAKFTGYRYLMDAVNTREYALRYEDGAPRPPIGVYAALPREKGFRPNETVFAFADDAVVQLRDGQPFVQVDVFQILIGDNGNPSRLTVTAAEYAVSFDTKDKRFTKAVLALTDESKAQMAAEGFLDSFPAQFVYDLDETQVTRANGSVTVSRRALEALPVPPNHDRYAVLARINHEQEMAQAVVRGVQAAQTPQAAAAVADTKGGRDFSAPDAQTLVEKKDMGDGDSLKIVFNFESRRVTESVLSAKGVALTSHKFKDYDEAALEAAFTQLQKLGGSPRPLEGVKKPAGLKRPGN
jgi:hypothetical protein